MDIKDYEAKALEEGFRRIERLDRISRKALYPL